MKRSAVHVARSLRAMGDEATVVGPLSDGDPGRGFQGFVVHIHEPLVPPLTYYALWSSLPSAHVCTFHMYTEQENRA